MGIILSFLAKPLDKHGTTPVHITYPPLETLAQYVMQIVKLQVGIISLDALYCKSIVKMKSPMTAEIVLTARRLTCPESAHLIHEFLKYGVNSKSRRRHCHWTIYQELYQLMIRAVLTFTFLLTRGMVRLVCHLLCFRRSLIQRHRLGLSLGL